MKVVFLAIAGLAAGGLWLAPACSPNLGIDLSNVPEGGVGPDGGALGGSVGGVGDPCDNAAKICRPGLTCTAGLCQPSHATAIGGDCQISAECNNGFCGADRKCAAAGAGAAGATCTSDADCVAGLRCDLVGLSTQCTAEGTKDLGDDCTTSADCFGGLICAANKCAPTQPGVITVPQFTGVACETETGDPAAYFDVPRGGAALKDFFRLPYPNDIRVGTDGKLSLKDFPTPGKDILGFDLVDRYARFLEQTASGYSEYPTVTFRFNTALDFDSLNGQGVTRWVEFGATPAESIELGLLYSARTNRTAYVCPNSVSFRPPTGAPLKPGKTYAVIMSTAVKTTDAKAVAVPGDLKTILTSAADPGGDLSAAWQKYAPLRAWAAAKSVDVNTILNASVFTVGTPDAAAKAIPAAITANPTTLKTGTTWTKCDVGTTSPCPQHDGDRNCPATPSPDFDEYHAILSMPLFQKGNAPFIAFGDDGTFDPNSTPTMIDVCASITFKHGDDATSGPLPVVVYAHGTGGSFRSQATENVASRMAQQGIAVLGIDQVGHGTRRGTSTNDPSTIFFNVANPPAAQGNVLQGAADQVSLVSFLQKNGATAIGNGVTLDPSRIAYWGHSQGATEGAVSMPYASGVAGAVFSGEGGSLIDSLLTKTQPTNIKALGPYLISELPTNLDRFHPVLALLQNAIDPGDPVDHAFAMNPVNQSEGTRKHVFQPFGELDSFATPITELTYATAANLDVAPNAPSATHPAEDFIKPASATAIHANASGFTAVTRHYGKPATADGHFVVYDDPDAKKDADAFLRDVLSKTPVVPTVPAL